jgi:hypothetical protein
MKRFWTLSFFLWTACAPVHLDTVVRSQKQVPANSACQKTYSQFFEKDLLDFRVVFGYKDARPTRFVGDRYERAYFIEKLLKFGFKRDPENELLFHYELKMPDGKSKIIRLKVIASSAGPDDDENRKDPHQKWMSEQGEGLFLSGLREADLVFYYGHSRDGGGPDFTPPKLRTGNHTDYDWYVRNKPGLKKMISALKRSSKPTSIIGLFSCVSDRLFNDEIRKASPHTAILGSHALLYYSDAIDGMMESLSDLLEQKCQQEFHPAGIEVFHLFD